MRVRRSLKADDGAASSCRTDSGSSQSALPAGAIPEALAIAREVFVSVWGRDDLTELLPDWIRSLDPGETEPPPVTGAAIGNAISLLEPALDTPGSTRALTNLCAERSDSISLTRCSYSATAPARSPVNVSQFRFLRPRQQVGHTACPRARRYARQPSMFCRVICAMSRSPAATCPHRATAPRRCAAPRRLVAAVAARWRRCRAPCVRGSLAACVWRVRTRARRPSAPRAPAADSGRTPRLAMR